MEQTTQLVSKKTYTRIRSFLRYGKSSKQSPKLAKTGLKVAFIHNEKKIATGAHHINQLMAEALGKRGAQVRNFFPRHQLSDTPVHLKGIANILFFHSLLEHKNEILKNHIIQGTTYTPLPFLSFSVPVVCHFGSTIRGYLDAVPATSKLPKEEQKIFKELLKLHIVPELDLKTFRPMEDVADIEAVAATRATACIATSENVKRELMKLEVPEERIQVIYNAIEDYWFATAVPLKIQPPQLVFLGRLGNDVFTLKLKGFSRLVSFYRAFPDVAKTTVCMTTNSKLKDWLRVAFPNHYMFTNLRKDLIPGALAPLYGSILFLPSRYEGFSLSLIEGMSQGLVPIAYPVGVVPEVIRNGENGYIVSSLAEARRRAKELLRDEPKRLAMAASAKESVQRFRSKIVAGELLTLYHALRGSRKTANEAQ
jgi:glycosyltransferase involved in cell wall biosynthesis